MRGRQRSSADSASRAAERLVVANWKMNKTRAEARAFRDTFEPRFSGVEIGIAPPYPYLSDLAGDERWALAGQDCSAEKSGAFTGEVSAAMLASCGCRYVILGHSERRRNFHEGETLLAGKLARAREAGIVPIFCVGETLEEREEGLTNEVLRRQAEALERDPADLPLVVAYEPVWAIGTGRNATPEQAEETIRHLRGLLAPRRPRILYGGSVTPDNAAQLAAREGISGFLVGGASLDSAAFA
ncbi:MAG TPA: triose-phosphate isomerase, partial [Thermoanaerobaculia bacterium]|nr:triose-phosphate isomerase [Thermoanaerobaculia bacterium]